MKGVKINNYIDNRIVLSGRKLKNEVQTLITSNRPRPLVIRHLNYFEQEEDQAVHTDEKQTLKAIENRTAKKQKKKSKINVGNNQATNPSNQHSSQKVQKKQKIKKQITKRDKTLSGKKRSSQSSPSGRSENQFNSTQKKLRSVPKNGEGLGKRSKSAIIKRNKSPSNVQIEADRKVSQDKNMKIVINTKKQQEISKKKKTKKDKDKKLAPSKGKQSKKNLSTLNISERKKKDQKESGLKTSRPPSKSYVSSSIHSKPVSARQNKKRDTNIVKNLFGQTERERDDRKSEHITLQQLLSIQKNDFKIKNAIMKLEDAINSKGSRKKLSQKLQLLAQKLKEIDSQKSESEEESYNESISGEKDKKIVDNKDSRVRQFIPNDQSRQSNKRQSIQEDEKSIKQFKNPQIVSKLAKKTIEQIQSDNKQLDSQGYEQINIDHLENQQSEDKAIDIQKKENYRKDLQQRRIQFDRSKGKLMRQDDEEEEEVNIMIGRKGGADVLADLVDYQSINSVKSNQDDKTKEINQLKKFQEESDLMMKRIKQMESKKKSEQQKAELKIEEPVEQVVIPPVKNNGHVSPRALQVNNYAFEKYPTSESLRSPKFNSQQLISVIKLKERVLTDRHEKLSELVNVMFDKKIVSPKTYSLQVQSLRQQHIHNNEVLDSYKKHAEELAQLLSEIKKQKQEISTIDEMIRSQKWDQAIKVINEGEKQLKIKKPQPKISEQARQKISSPLDQRQKSSDQNSEPVYYEGQDSEVSDVGIKLIQIQNDEENKEQMKQSLTSLIKIDESSHSSVKKQKGFDSNLFFIKEYCIALCQFVRDNYRADFRFRIGKPMSFDLNKLLRSFRTNRDGSVPYTVNSLFQDLSYHDCDYHFNTPPISLQIFNQFNKQYASIKYYGKQESQDATLQGIFLKSIYDALNESINIQKPGSLNGKALPWAHNSKHLKNLKNSLKNSQQEKFKNQQSQDLIFGIAIARIIQWGSCLCGFIPDTVELENTQIDQEYVNHIRETRTALLLEKMLADEEASMYRTQLEETEVKLCLTQIIFDDLAKQLGHEMRKIVLRATLRDVDY